MNPEERSEDDSEENSSSQDEPDLRRPAEPVAQMSHEGFPSLTAAEMHRRSGVSDQQHPLASCRNPYPGLIPSCLVSPLNLMGLPLWVQNSSTLMLCSPFAPQTSQSSIVSFVSHAPSSRPSPRVLGPSSSPQVFCWSGMGLFPTFIPPMGWYRTQVPVQQTNNPALFGRRPEIHLLNENVTPPSVLDNSLAGTQDKQQKAADETEALENLKKYLKAPPGHSSSWERNLRFEPCEDCMEALMPLCSEVTDDTGEDQRDESETIGNPSFLEYLDDLCNDEDFVQNVEMTLNPDFLNAILSSDPDALDLSALEQQLQEQETSSDPLPVTLTTSPPSPPDLTSSYLNSDPLSKNRDSHEESKENLCRPLVESWLLEEEADRLLDNTHPSFEENRIPVKTCSTACPYCCFLVDNTFTLPDDTTLTDIGPDSPSHKWTPVNGMQDSPSDGSCFYMRTKATNGRIYEKNLKWLENRKQETSMAEKKPVRQSQRLLDHLKKTREKEMMENTRKLGENGQIKSQLFKEEGNKKEKINQNKAESSIRNRPKIRAKTGKPVHLLPKLAQPLKSKTSGATRTKAKSTAAERAEDRMKTQIKQQKAGKRKLGKETQQLVSSPVKKRRTEDQDKGQKQVKVRQKATRKAIVKDDASEEPLKKTRVTKSLPKRPKKTPKAAPETSQWSVVKTGELKLILRSTKTKAKAKAGPKKTEDVEGSSRLVGPQKKVQNKRRAPVQKQGSKEETGKAKVQSRAAKTKKNPEDLKTLFKRV